MLREYLEVGWDYWCELPRNARTTVLLIIIVLLAGTVFWNSSSPATTTTQQVWSSAWGDPALEPVPVTTATGGTTNHAAKPASAKPKPKAKPTPAPHRVNLSGIDYCCVQLNPGAIKSHHYAFVARYLISRHPNWQLTASELRGFRAHHLAIVVIAERQKTSALGGYNAGKRDARDSAARIRALHLPTRSVIYFTVDFQPVGSQMKTVHNYLAGAGSVIGAARVGVYGSYSVVRQAMRDHTAHYFWQTRAWSGGKVENRANIQQTLSQAFAGGADIDHAHSSNYGQLAA